MKEFKRMSFSLAFKFSNGSTNNETVKHFQNAVS